MMSDFFPSPQKTQHGCVQLLVNFVDLGGTHHANYVFSNNQCGVLPAVLRILRLSDDSQLIELTARLLRAAVTKRPWTTCEAIELPKGVASLLKVKLLLCYVELFRV